MEPLLYIHIPSHIHFHSTSMKQFNPMRRLYVAATHRWATSAAGLLVSFLQPHGLFSQSQSQQQRARLSSRLKGPKGQTCWQRVVVFCATVAVNNRRETMVLPIRGDTKLCPLVPLFPSLGSSFYVHGTHVACHNCTSACAVIFIFCNFRCPTHTLIEIEMQ